MTRGAGAFAACLALTLVALCACSGGGKQTRRLPSVAPCPKDYPFAIDTYDGANGTDASLGKTVIPVDARTAEVCRYTRSSSGQNDFALVGSTVLDERAARRLKDDTNHLVSVPVSTERPACPSISKNLVYIVFSGTSSRIRLYDVSCGFITNGSLNAHTTARWRSDVANLIHGPSKGSTTTS